MSDRPAFDTIALPLGAYDQIKRDEMKTAYEEIRSDLRSKIDVLLNVVSVQQNRIISLQSALDQLSVKVDSALPQPVVKTS